MKIEIEKYDPNWVLKFNEIEEVLSECLKQYSPRIEHIGSTSVPDLSAKPVIDIAIGLKSKDWFDEIIELMINSGFIYLSAFNSFVPDRRFFVFLKNKENFDSEYSELDQIPKEELHANKIANIHIWFLNSHEWNRHVVFRDYLRVNSVARKKYQLLKEELGRKNWFDGNQYNLAKNDFIRSEELKALKWFEEKKFS